MATKLLRMVIALSVAVLLYAGGFAHAQDSVQTPPALASALARQRDAESLAHLGTEGRLLYGRERVKLTGYQYCSQAVSLAERGEFRQSIRAASKALFLGRRDGDADLLASSLRDLAIAYSYAGNLERAEEYAREALGQGAKNEQLIVAPANKVLGDVALRRGQTARAVERYREAMRVASDRYRPVVELSLANAQLAAGDVVAARVAYDAIKPPSDAAFRMTWLRGLGQLQLAERRPQDALATFGSLLAGAGGTDAAYHRLWAHEGMGRAHLALNDQQGAVADYAAAVNAADAMRARFRSEEFKAALFGDVQQVLERALVLSMRSGNAERAFEISEKSRSRALLDLIRERVPAASVGADPRTALALDAGRVRSALAAGEAIVQFHTVDDAVFAWVVRRDGIEGFEIPVARTALATRITAFRDAVVDRKPEALALSAELHALLIAPLRLRAGDRLIVVPHGPLHYLAFQALREGESYLIERHPISVAPSSTIAIDTVSRGRREPGELVAFGNPTTEERYALPGSEREVQRIGALFPQSRVFLRNEASRQRFTETAGLGRVLHVAAHAEADEVDPLFSRILLARDGDDPGFLEAREIFGLDLSRVSLVALSACESGLGSSQRGDEVLGFTRSFLGAGAASLVSSLWPVDDDSTEFLMAQLYGELAKGVDLQTALQTAQVAAMKRPRFRHPFFWAPFVAMGDWRQRLTVQ